MLSTLQLNCCMNEESPEILSYDLVGGFSGRIIVIRSKRKKYCQNSSFFIWSSGCTLPCPCTMVATTLTSNTIETNSVNQDLPTVLGLIWLKLCCVSPWVFLFCTHHCPWEMVAGKCNLFPGFSGHLNNSKNYGR